MLTLLLEQKYSLCHKSLSLIHSSARLNAFLPGYLRFLLINIVASFENENKRALKSMEECTLHCNTLFIVTQDRWPK